MPATRNLAVNGYDADPITTDSPRTPGTVVEFFPVTGEGDLPRKPARAQGVITMMDSVRSREEPVTIDEIYRVPEVGSIHLRTALTLLKETISWADGAIHGIDNGELIRADEALIHVQMAMPELFCCRALGDGFGAIINAIQSAFENREQSKGTMDRIQICLIRTAMATVRNEPRLSYTRALDLISSLENAGLIVEPAPVDALAEWLDD